MDGGDDGEDLDEDDVDLSYDDEDGDDVDSHCDGGDDDGADAHPSQAAGLVSTLLSQGMQEEDAVGEGEEERKQQEEPPRSGQPRTQISHDLYKKISQLASWYVGRHQDEGEAAELGVRWGNILAWVGQDMAEELDEEMGLDTAGVRGLLSRVIKRLVKTDQVLVLVSEASAKGDDRRVRLHPSYA